LLINLVFGAIRLILCEEGIISRKDDYF